MYVRGLRRAKPKRAGAGGRGVMKSDLIVRRFESSTGSFTRSVKSRIVMLFSAKIETSILLRKADFFLILILLCPFSVAENAS